MENGKRFLVSLIRALILPLLFFLIHCKSATNISGSGGDTGSGESSDSVPVCDASAGCTEIAFTKLESGGGNIQIDLTGAQYTFTDAAKFSDFYNQFVCSTRSPCTTPTVDFQTNMAIAVIKGQSPVGCVDIEIEDIQDNNGVITVYVFTYDPDENDICASSFANPYEIVVMPLISKEINFNYTAKNISEKE